MTDEMTALLALARVEEESRKLMLLLEEIKYKIKLLNMPANRVTDDDPRLKDSRRPLKHGESAHTGYIGLENQIKFDIASGHHHDGVDSKLILGSDWVTPTGTGFTHITAGALDAAAKLIANADVAADAAIAYSKLALGTSIKASDLTADAATADIVFIIDGGGSAITTGQKGHLEIPFACTILQATLLADQSGSIVVDIWKDTYANFPPTDADSITASAPPTLSSAQNSQDSTLTGWTKTIAAGDILAFNVDSATTVTRVTLSLKVKRT